MGCAVGTVKFVIFIFNFILVCLGFGMVLLGALDSPMPDELSKIPEFANELSITSKVLIIAGAIIFVVAFFGCWGAVSDSSCMLFLYALFLMALILLELAVGVYVYINRETVEVKLSSELKKWIKEYDNDTNAKTVIDNMQYKMQCCGIDNSGDWIRSRKDLPASCCKEKSGYCPQSSAFPEGCLKKGVRLLTEKVKKYAWAVSAVIGAEVVTIFFALIVRNSIINQERRSYA